MKTILHLSTGGTIASTRGAGGIAPAVAADALLERLPSLKRLCRIESRPVMSADSTNLRPQDWSRIAEEVWRGQAGYDGIVITHGTHTMAYTAAALSLMIRGPRRPIVLTGAQLPFDDEGTDGTRNLLDAFLTACQPAAGVFVVFGGRIMAGDRVVKLHSRRLDAFRSANAADLGEVAGGRLRWLAGAPPAAPAAPPRFLPAICPQVLLLKLSPGFDSRLLDLLPGLGVRGLVIEGYGVGIIPFAEPDLALRVKGLIERGVCVVFTTQCPFGGTDLAAYAIGRECLALGAVEGGEATPEALVVRLMWALGQTRDPREARRLMAGEEPAGAAPGGRTAPPPASP